MAHVKAIYVCFDQCDDRWELLLAVSGGFFFPWLAGRSPPGGGRCLFSGCEETTSKRAGEQFSSDVSVRQRSPVHFRRRFTTGGCTTCLRCRILRLDPTCASNISLSIGDASPSIIQSGYSSCATGGPPKANWIADHWSRLARRGW